MTTFHIWRTTFFTVEAEDAQEAWDLYSAALIDGTVDEKYNAEEASTAVYDENGSRCHVVS